MAWPLPIDPDARLVPDWSVADTEAQQLGMPFPAFLEWAATDEGARWLTRLRLKWRIVAAAERQAQEERAAGQDDATWRGQGWRGGYCDPAETSIFDDEAPAA